MGGTGKPQKRIKPWVWDEVQWMENSVWEWHMRDERQGVAESGTSGVDHARPCTTHDRG